MNMHKNARMTPFGRERVVRQVVEGQLAAVEAAQLAGISVRSLYKWVRRFRTEGAAGMLDRHCRPRRVRCALTGKQKIAIERLRRDRRTYREICQRIKAPLSTVARFAASIGLNRLERLEPKAPVQRYEHDRPGELVHLDTKRLARFRRPGHRIHGDRKQESPGAGWQFLHVAIDDHARVAYGELFSDERTLSALRFLTRLVRYYGRLGIKIARVLTDNGAAYRSKAFRRACERLGIRHSRTRSYRPQTNGKAERFIQTTLREWAYARSYANDLERAKAWLPWLHHYNWHRPHSSLDYKPPIRRLGLSVNNLSGLHT